MFWWVFRKQDAVEGAFIKGKDFKSIWHASMEWLNFDPQNIDSTQTPQEVGELIHKIILGFLKKDLVLRRRCGGKVPHEPLPFFFWDENYYRVKLWDCLSSGNFDKELLRNLYVERSNILGWCEKERIAAPKYWAPSNETHLSQAIEEIADDNNDGWYNALTERRKQKVACLEVAKELWKINPNQTYHEVFHHPDMKKYGHPNNFSFNTFKTWSRSFAPEYATNGGRRKESTD